MTDAADQLLGRAAELEAIDRAIGELCEGSSTPLVIQGEPGIGKTRLLAELAGRADARGCIVLGGSASELERDLPFWVFVDALDEYVAGLDPHLVGSLPEEVRSELAHVMPSLSEFASGGAPMVQDERYRAHRAVRELLERLAAGRPLVLLLDDVHWADAASVDLLAALLRSPPDAAVLVVMASRPRQRPERLVTALERADRNGGLAQLELGGLARDAAGALLGDGVGRERADVLYEEAGGNPFYLQQLARSHGAPARPVPGQGDLEAIGVPGAVVASINEELAVLPADTRRVLRGAAVAGDPFEPDLAAAAAGADDATAMEALDVLLELGLARTTDVPRRFRFRHPLVRRAVYESAPGGWLLGAHERCAQVLAARGAPAPARAHHVEFAARHGDLAAVAVLTEAGTAATLRAPASAARWFSAALRLLPGDVSGGQRVELLLARARALAAEGRLAESHADLLESIQLAPADAVGLRVQLATTCAGVERLLGRHGEAHERLVAGLDQLPDRAGPDAIALMIELAIDGLFRADPDAVRDWSTRSLRAARELGERPLIAAAAAMLALGHAVAGSIAAAQAAYDEASALVAAMSDEELGARVDAAAYLTSAATYLDRYDEAVVHAERALRLGRAAGRLHPTLLPALGAAHFMRGRLEEAAMVLDDDIEAGRLSGITQSMAWALRNRALLSVVAGDLDAALDMAEEAHELTRRLDQSVLTSWAAMAVARASVMAGQSQRAIDVLASGEATLSEIPGAWRAMGLDALASAYADLGRGDEAARTAATAEAHAAALGLPMAIAWAQHAVAAVAMHAGEHRTAAERASASAAAAEEAGAVIEAALSRMLAGRAFAAAGQPDRAVVEIQSAAATFETCGARPHRDAAERELRRLGKRVHRRTRPGTAGAEGLAALTERELQVTGLVVDRNTNPQIAAELFLSQKTVETHLRNIFHKLGVSSRVELARIVERSRREH
ncbi:MAG TPA: AAA family ATPase [Solirubrobacteraceae bacterium]|nr:AAA family ATPase [Solirubrobacteraceae bacterium]